MGSGGVASAAPSTHARVTTWAVDRLAYLVAQRKATGLPDRGMLLDHTFTLFFSDMGDRETHSPVHLPVLLARRGGGGVPTGPHRVFPGGTTPESLRLSLLQAHGHPAARFGARGLGPLLDLR